MEVKKEASRVEPLLEGVGGDPVVAVIDGVAELAMKALDCLANLPGVRGTRLEPGKELDINNLPIPGR